MIGSPPPECRLTGITPLLAVWKIACAALASGSPSVFLAPAATSIDTLAPYGSAAFGSNTRTVSISAQWTEPATDFPPTETENARAVLARSIACVKRTESTASRAILVLFATGRKRTTAGAVVVWTATRGLLEREAVGVADAGDDEPVADVGAERGRGHEFEAGRAARTG